MSTEATRISPKAAHLIKRDAIHAYKSIPRRGAESGGILCGAGGPDFYIETMVPVAIEYRLGPSYLLSDADKAAFQSAIDANKNVIGWYRSNTRKSDGLTEQDRETARLFFGASESAFLLCFPDAQQNVQGRLHIWANGEKERTSELPLGKFSLLEEALQSQKNEEPAPLPPPSEPERAVRVPEPPAFTLVGATPGPASSWLRLALIAAIVLPLVYFSASYLRSQLGGSDTPAVQANVVGLGLKVDRQGKALLIDWDRKSAAVLEATDATFSIAEGTHNKVLQLSAKELRSGGLFYTPQTDEDVQVELALHNPAGNLAQSLRIIQNPAPQPVPPSRK